MLAAIHIRQTVTAAGPLSCAALATDTGVALFTRAGGTAEARFAAGLDAFAELCGRAGNVTARLHLTDADLRRELRAVADSFPTVALVDVGYGPLGALARAAADAIGEHVAAVLAAEEVAREAATNPPAEQTVATDASKGSRRGVGLACVGGDGSYRQKVCPDTRSILAGELLAIELAVTTYRNRPLHILSDSRHALAGLRGEAPLTTEASVIVDRIRHRTRGLPIRYSWVRGHSGHPLNEVADRLAVAARRAHEAQLPSAARQTIAENIVASLSTPASAAA
ncbi:ribonuclease H family protein [Rhodococcus aetherivorans]